MSSTGIRTLIHAGIVVCMAGLAVSAEFGQDRTTCGLAGTVTDANRAPLAGATVRIESHALIGGPRSVTTGKDGRFRFSDLPPGEYTITVDLQGYKTVVIEKTRLSVGMNAEIPIGMVPYAGVEVVRVLASPVPIDTTSSSTSTVLPPEILRNIPTDRDTSHVLDLAPGINIESAYGGGEEAGNSYEVDGVDISDPEGGAPWSLFNYSLIDEVQIAGLGAPAEYGGFTGAVFNSVTRSGGNDVSGSAELYYTNEALSGLQNHKEGSLQVGGPFRKDRLWYFASGQYVSDISNEGGPDQTETDPRLFTKLTWQASPANIVQGWLEEDHPRVIGRNGDEFTPLEATANENNPELVWNLAWRSILSARSILNVTWAGYTGYHHFDPHNGFSIPGRIDAQTGFASNNAALFQKLDRTRNQLNASLTHAAGNHDAKFGTEIERSLLHSRAGFPGDAFFSDNEGPQVDPSTGNPDSFTLAFLGGGYEVRPKNERISLYAQDAWRITPRFTLNPGVRVDLNRGSVSGATVFRTTGLAPRIGFAWDLKGDAKSVLRAHYGRYYEALYSTFYQFIDQGAFFPLTKQRTFNTSGFTDTVATLPGRSVSGAPGIRQPYLDQYILGFDREVFHGTVVSGTLVFRRSADFIEIVSRNGQFVPVPGQVPGTGQQVTLFDYLNPTTDVLVYDNPRGLNRTYRGAIFSLTRRMSGNWQLVASYVYSQARGNVDNLLGFDTSIPDTNNPDLLGQVLQTPNSLVNARGRLTHDQTHQIKLQATWILPSRHLSVSGNYTFHSGDTWTPRTDCLLTDDGNGVIGDGILGCHSFPQGPFQYLAEPRGSRRLPARNELDLRIEWYHDSAKGGRLRLFADAFNLNNQTRPTEVETLVGPNLGQPATENFSTNVRFGLGFEW